MTADDLRQLPIEVGLQTETGYPHKGKLDYAAPTLNQSTGTLPVRGVLPNSDRVAAAGIFRPRPRPLRPASRTRCSCPTSRSAAIRPDAIVLVVNGENVVEQRKVQIGPLRGRACA